MVIVRFQGGLGNQMFQRAFLESIKKYSNDVRADLSEFNGISYHNGYEISSVFDDKCETAKWSDIAKCANFFQIPHHTVIGSYLNCYFRNMLNSMRKGKYRKPTHIYEDQFLKMTQEEIIGLINRYHLIYLDGWWFEKKIYDSVDLSHIFAFSEVVKDKCKAYKDMIEKTESCSLHIRLGDYVNNSVFGILGMDYYHKAIQYIRNLAPETVFYVFSDDIERAKEQLGETDGFEYVETVDKNDSGVDMYLMSCCKNNIIANSSYSFWGAKLNRNTEKTVVAPERFTSKLRFDIAIDEGWHII